MTRQNAEPAVLHQITQYGTVNCPVELVRAEIDDVGDCSACGLRVAPSAPTHAETACTCGSDATSLNPAEVVVHQHNGEPCYIAPTHADEGGGL